MFASSACPDTWSSDEVHILYGAHGMRRLEGELQKWRV